MTPERGRDPNLSERIYRVLLAAYPEEFRRQYGAQMEQMFRDLCRDETGRSRGLARLWVRMGLDLASSAVVERIRAGGKEQTLRDYKLAGVGLVLILAPLYFVAASLLKYGLGVGFLYEPLELFLSEPGRRSVFNLISPVVFFGGLVLALALNGRSFVRLDLSREGRTIESTVRLEMKLANIAVVVVGLLLLGTLAGYVFAENFAYRY